MISYSRNIDRKLNESSLWTPMPTRIAIQVCWGLISCFIRHFSVSPAIISTNIFFFFTFNFFPVAFIFNWIGFLLLMCFCRTIASRYGALSGFGLSLAKWTLIVKHSTDLASKDNSWLWWLIMTFGKFS